MCKIFVAHNCSSILFSPLLSIIAASMQYQIEFLAYFKHYVWEICQQCVKYDEHTHKLLTGCSILVHTKVLPNKPIFTSPSDLKEV